MRKKIIIITVILTLTIGILYETLSIYKTLINKSNIDELTEINVNELKDNKNLAIMVRDDASGEYSEMGSRDAWPEYPNYIYMKAECDDGSGSKLVGTNVINYDEQNNKLTMTTKTTMYCTLYFAPTNDAFTLLAEKGGTTFKKAFNNDTMHRFVGDYNTVKNNYICFGTDNLGDCLKSPATYMYRIIGITDSADSNLGLEAHQLKIIKAEPNSDGKSVAWHSDIYSDTPWDSADVQKTYLNTTFIKTITGTVGTSNWTDVISNPKWYIGDNTSANITNVEVTSKTSQNHKIGLMYASDYYNAGTQNTNNWLNICHGRTGTSMSCSSYNEWTMTRYGYLGFYYSAWYVLSSSAMTYDAVTGTIAVRPVFYLKSNITLAGEGTEANPFIITSKN